MLKLFEKSTVVQALVILLVTALLWFKSFINPQPMMPTDNYAPLYNLLCSLHPSPVLSTIIALTLVVLGGFFFNIMVAGVGLASQNSLLPTLLFIMAMSAVSPALTPSLLAALIVIAIIKMLMLRSSLLAVSADKIFGVASLIGIASMIYLPALTLVAAYLLIAVNYRLYSWRDWMVFLLGLLAPYLLLWSVQLFTDDLVDGFAAMGDELSNFTLTVGSYSTLHSIANIPLLAAFLVSLFVVWRRLGEKPIVWQKNATTVMLVTVAAIAMLPFTQVYPVNLQFFAVPFAFCLSQRFALSSHRSRTSRSSWRSHLFDILFILILIAAVVC